MSRKQQFCAWDGYRFNWFDKERMLYLSISLSLLLPQFESTFIKILGQSTRLSPVKWPLWTLASDYYKCSFILRAFYEWVANLGRDFIWLIKMHEARQSLAHSWFIIRPRCTFHCIARTDTAGINIRSRSAQGGIQHILCVVPGHSHCGRRMAIKMHFHKCTKAHYKWFWRCCQSRVVKPNG